MYVSVAHHVAELLERDLAVLVLVGEQDGLVHDLLQLRVLQVVAHHHLQHLQQATLAVTTLLVPSPPSDTLRHTYLEQFSVGDKPVVVHVVDTEREPQLGQLIALHAELRHALDELLEVHLQQRTGNSW